jgi:hypothetical protein
VGGGDGGLAGIVHDLILPGYEGTWQMGAEGEGVTLK